MPRIPYIFKRFHGGSREIIERADQICREYDAAGYGLTLRQLYYQFVARGWLDNSDKNYKRLGSIINDARLAGEIDWMHLQDRTRGLTGHLGTYGEPGEVIANVANSYHRDLWVESQQAYRPQVWVEKEALVDVVQRACRTYHVPYLACRGYVSQSEMWRRGAEMRRQFVAGLTPIVIHLGDHDPSGIDMTRDITDRLAMFAGHYVEVQRIALNMDQIEEYNPPPNPAKLTDSRGSAYVEEYGHESWELDALDPATLDALVRERLSPYIDVESWEAADRVDEDDRSRMRVVAERWDDISQRWGEVEELLDN